MHNVWKFIFSNGLAVLASLTVSFMIMTVSLYCSLGLFSIIIAPLIGGFFAAYVVLFLLEDGEFLYLAQTFWHTLLLGATAAQAVAVVFVCAVSQHHLFY